jgi:type IV pilus assembly protein PilA
MKMNRKGFTLVEIMIVVAIIALLAAIAIPNLLSAKRTANTAAAKANIRALSTAAEVYATAKNGTYPTSTQVVDYIAAAATLCGATVQGYVYNCTGMTATGYTITATPSSTTTGDTTFSVTNGGVITETAYTGS